MKPALENAFSASIRVRKTDGVGTFTRRGIEWSPSPPDLATGKQAFVILWSSIRNQQVSSTNSPKALIRLQLTKSSLVLEFTHLDLTEAFRVRNTAKDWILRQTKGSGTSTDSAQEIRYRASILASQPLVKHQYQEMVESKVISEDDFWSTRQQLLANEAGKRQRVAKTSNLLTDLTTQQDKDANGKVVKYNLNAEVIHQLFVQYPAVHRAYKAQVPDRMTEKEFWGTFFKSKYFHRDRQKKAGAEDMFTKFEEEEKQHQTKRIPTNSTNQQQPPPRDLDELVDLCSTAGDAVLHPVVDGMKKHTRLDSKDERLSETLMQFNRHAAYVLEPSQPGKFQFPDRFTTKANVRQDSVAKAIRLPDLELPVEPTFVPLLLENEKRYFEGRNFPSNERPSSTTINQNQNLNITCVDEQNVQQQLQQAFPSSKEALRANERLSKLIASESVDQTAGGPKVVDIPENFKTQIFDHFQTISELLRHFWSFNKSKKSNLGAEKLERIVLKMEEKYEELQKIRSSLPPDQRNTLGPLLKPFDDQLNHAFVQREQQLLQRTTGDRLDLKRKR